MVNFKKLASRAQVAKDAFNKQGGTDALKEKANRIKGVARGSGSVGDKAKAASQVAREKPNPAHTPGEGAQGPIGGGEAPPPVSQRPAPVPAPAPTPADERLADDPAPATDAPASDPDVPAAAAGEPVVDPDAPADPLADSGSERPTDR